MFKVENADFIADKLAAELLPHQEMREVTKNAEDAIRRRMTLDNDLTGRMELDVDWALRESTGNWYLSCADDGDGMTRAELEKYTTTLAVKGASQTHSLIEHQGMGLKISGPTRHKEGVLIRSMKAGERSMVQIGWDPEKREYGLIPLGHQGQSIVTMPEDHFPECIRERGSGTVVTFLGNSVDDNTFVPAGEPKGWLFRYLNRRYFTASEDGIAVYVRVPSGDEEDWPQTRAEAHARTSGKDKGPSFNLSRVKGTARIWTDAANTVTDGTDRHGIVRVPGDPATGIPASNIHWWVLPAEGIDVSTRTYGTGSMAVLFQNELHDWRVGAQANPYFARMGVIYGKNRIGFVIEPLGDLVRSDFARAHVLVSGTPVLEHDAWHVWADQFRAELPESIQKVMAEERARLAQEDPERAKRIRNRLKDVLQLLRPRKFRPKTEGPEKAGGPEVSGTGDDEKGQSKARGTTNGRASGGRRGIGAALTQVTEDGEPASEEFSIMDLEPRWVTEAEADGMTIVNGNGQGLRDRAAALAGQDAATAPVLLLSTEFRGYQTMAAALSEWANPEGDDTKAARIDDALREWIEQKMVEAVHGLRQLENGSTWLPGHFDDALSPVGLTAVFMADRYHTMNAVRRVIAPIRAK